MHQTGEDLARAAERLVQLAQSHLEYVPDILQMTHTAEQYIKSLEEQLAQSNSLRHLRDADLRAADAKLKTAEQSIRMLEGQDHTVLVRSLEAKLGQADQLKRQALAHERRLYTEQMERNLATLKATQGQLDKTRRDYENEKAVFEARDHELHELKQRLEKAKQSAGHNLHEVARLSGLLRQYANYYNKNSEKTTAPRSTTAQSDTGTLQPEQGQYSEARAASPPVPDGRYSQASQSCHTTAN